MIKMKKVIAVMAALVVMMALAACGGSDTQAQEPAREDRAGFNSKTNKVIEVGGYSFEIPDYYVLDEEHTGETDSFYQIANGEAIVRFATNDEVSGSREDFDKSYDGFVENVIRGISKDAKSDGNIFTYEVNGTSCSGRVELLYNESSHTVVGLIFVQKDESTADYLPDFKKVVRSAKLTEVEPAAGGSGEEDSDDNNSADSDSVDNDSGLISPEFKKTMDDYEAWFDHYCDVMKRYQEDTTDLALMSEMLDLLSEEADMLEQMENMDQSEMSDAELAYYLEVTLRIEKKLLEIAY